MVYVNPVSRADLETEPVSTKTVHTKGSSLGTDPGCTMVDHGKVLEQGDAMVLLVRDTTTGSGPDLFYFPGTRNWYGKTYTNR